MVSHNNGPEDIVRELEEAIKKCQTYVNEVNSRLSYIYGIVNSIGRLCMSIMSLIENIHEYVSNSANVEWEENINMPNIKIEEVADITISGDGCIMKKEKQAVTVVATEDVLNFIITSFPPPEFPPTSIFGALFLLLNYDFVKKMVKKYFEKVAEWAGVWAHIIP